MARVKELTNGRGADAIIEGVGHADALRTGFDLLRPWGTISSFGVHNGEIPWSGTEAYGKNLRVQMGRCPVRSKLGYFSACLLTFTDIVEVFSLKPLKC